LNLDSLIIQPLAYTFKVEGWLSTHTTRRHISKNWH
jgi:hypothetical protein